MWIFYFFHFDLKINFRNKNLSVVISKSKKEEELTHGAPPKGHEGFARRLISAL